MAVSKKTVIISIFVVGVILATAVFCVAVYEEDSAFAFDKGGVYSGLDELKNVGYDLDGYDASITYRSYTLNTSGMLFAFDITLDKEFLLCAGNVEGSVYCYPEMFSELETLFSNNGYSVNTDKYNGRLTATIEFSSTTDYYIATGRDGFEVYSGSAEKNSGFLYTDYYSDSATVFYSVDEDGDSIIDVIYSKLLDLGADKEKILFTYAYGTPYKTIKSDADSIAYDNSKGIYVHSFNMNYGTKDRVIHLINHSPNAWGFYILAVICAIPIIAVPLVICFVKRKKEKEEFNG